MTRTTFRFVATIRADGVVVARHKVSVAATTEDGARRLVFARLGQRYPYATATLDRVEV